MEQRNVLPRIGCTHAVKLSVTIGLLLGLAGCAHSKGTIQSSTPAPVAEAAQAPAPAPAPAPVAAPAAAEVPSVEVTTQSVFFDFDRSDLKAPGQEFLSRFGDLLAKHPELHVRVEGNCDERGTAQYNVALGYRRAESAKTYLVQMGAATDQVSTVSNGKERPRAKGHDESAWSDNRRDDFIPDRATVGGKPVAQNP
ncbi:MAG TPA: OmpA family protein [Anaeromyxobacter sp.]|nr:OmpA family protein [Anaeromyxobacter sp.]